MGAAIRQDDSGIWLLRIFGALRKEELDAVQAELVKVLRPGDAATVLVTIERDFLGWMGDEVWNDMTFFVQHGEQIAKIAIVGDPKWETRTLMFTGAGFRRTQVKYFSGDRIKEARAWLQPAGEI